MLALALAAVALALLGVLSPRANAQEAHKEVIFVGNNWEGTADVLEMTAPAAGSPAGTSLSNQAKKARKKCRKARKRARGKGSRKAAKRKCRRAKRKRRAARAAGSRADEPVSLRRLGRLNIIPDLDQRIAEIVLNPVRLVYFLLIQQAVGEGNNQYLDDMYTSNDGELLIVSRPSFADVIGLRISTGEIEWRFPVAGQRSDHMAISPDGRHVAVSASTGNVVHILDVQTGQEVGQFPSGDSPHENTYSEDGERIYHASIGLVYTPLDNPLFNSTKGARYFQVNKADPPNELIKRIDIGQKAAEAGYPNMSSAVRPMAITRDESRIFMQVSFFHGFLEYDNVNDKVLRVANLPDYTNGMPRELYLLDSAHHGIAINGANDRLCVAGTMSDYAAMVDRDDFSNYTIHKEGKKPYWATTSRDGRYCYVSWSGSDSMSVFSYDLRKEVAEIPTGNHPQRIRSGFLSPAARASLKDIAPPAQPPPPLGPLPVTIWSLLPGYGS